MELKTNIDSGNVEIKRTQDGVQIDKKEDLITKEPEKKEEDLITKVSKVEIPQEPKKEDFNVTDIDKIEDPKAREYAEKAYKSFQRGFNQKFQDLATLRKEYEAKLNEPSNWTTEKVQELLKNEDFVKAAQQVAGVEKKEDYSALSEAERETLAKVQNQMNSLVNQNAQLLKQQQDETLKSKYANYDSQAVDILTNDLLKGKVQATREHLHKVLDYDDAVRRAYMLGKQDRKLETEEKATSLSPEGVTAVSNKEIPEPEKGESSRSFFKRLALNNVKKSSEASEVRK